MGKGVTISPKTCIHTCMLCCMPCVYCLACWGGGSRLLSFLSIASWLVCYTHVFPCHMPVAVMAHTITKTDDVRRNFKFVVTFFRNGTENLDGFLMDIC